jgi:hypothetical protein
VSEAIMVMQALAPVIGAAIEAAQRGGDWRKAAREALDAAEAADHGLAGPRADELEREHLERISRADEKTRPVKP